jgi:hypothetical protein
MSIESKQLAERFAAAKVVVVAAQSHNRDPCRQRSGNR